MSVFFGYLPSLVGRSTCFAFIFFLLFSATTDAQSRVESASSTGIVHAAASSRVDYNTGVLHYSIPMVSVSQNDLRVDVGISYAAKGIKAEQKPGSAGLGWSLSGIGVISRSVRGSEADEMWFQGKLDDTTSLANFLTAEHFDQINSKLRDGESDIFSLSYNHLSIRFILKKVNDSVIAVPLERTNVKIIIIGGMALKAFRVIDEEGNQFFFEDREIIGVYHKEGVVAKNYTSLSGIGNAWYLSRIRMFNGEEAFFEYSTDYVSESGSGSNEMAKYFGRPYLELKENTAIKASIEERLHQLQILGQDAASYRASIQSMYSQMNFKYWEYQDLRGEMTERLKSGDSLQQKLKELFQFTNQMNELRYQNFSKTIMNDVTSKKHLLDWNQEAAKILDAEINMLVKEYYKYVPVHWQYANYPTLYFFRPKIIKRIVLKNKEIRFNYKMGWFRNAEHLYLKTITEADLLQNQLRCVNLNIDTSDKGFLHSLVFTNSTGSDSIKYKFGYHLPESVPSTGQDYWGFYNGQSASSLIPADLFYTVKEPGASDQLVFVAGFPSMTQDPNTPDSIGGSKASRMPDIQYARLKVLNEVQLPEGGKIQFDYELNSINNGGDLSGTAGPARKNIPVGGLRIKSIRTDDGMGNSSETKYTYEFFTEDSVFRRSTGKLAVAGMHAFAFRVNYPNFTDHFVSSNVFDFSPFFSTIGNENVVYHYVEESKIGIGTTGYKFFNYTGPLLNGAKGDGPSSIDNTQFHWLEGLLLARAQYDTLNRMVSLDKYKYLIADNDVPGKLTSHKPYDYNTLLSDCFYNTDSFAFADKHIQIKANPGYYDSTRYAQQFFDSDRRLATIGSNTITYNLRNDYFIPNIAPRLRRDLPVMLYSISTGGKLLTKKITSYVFDPNAATVTSSSFPRMDRPYYFEWLLQGGISINQKSETEYFYDNPQHTYSTRMEEKGDNGDIYSTRIKYVMDYADAADQAIPKLKAANAKGSPVESQRWLFDAGTAKWFLLSGELTEYKDFISDSTSLILPVNKFNTSLPQKLEPGTGGWIDNYTNKPPFSSLFHENKLYYKLLEQDIYDVPSYGVVEQAGLKKSQSLIAETIAYDPFTGRQNAIVYNASPDEVFSLDLYWLRGPANRSPHYKFFKAKIDPLIPNFANPSTLLEKDCKEFLTGIYRSMLEMGIYESAFSNDSLFISMYNWYRSVGEGLSVELQDSLFTMFRNLSQNNVIKPATITACASFFNVNHAYTFAEAFNNWPPPRTDLFRAVFGPSRFTRYNGTYYELDFDIAAYKNQSRKMKIYGTGITSIPVKIYYADQSSYVTSIPLSGTVKYGIRTMLFDPATLNNWQQATRISFLVNNSNTYETLLIVPERTTFRCNIYSADETVNTMYDHNLDKISYGYDWQGRLSLVRDKNNFITKMLCYNYAGQPVNCRVFYNVEQRKVFTRNNCAVGLVGREYLMVVAAGKYAGPTQHAADSMALREVNQLGQSYANLYAACDTVLYKNQAISGLYNNQNCSLPETAVPLQVDIPANTYSSTISQAHANSLAQQAAQNYANAHGTCEFPDFVMNFLNTTSSTISVKFTNTITSNVYVQTIAPGTGGGTIPPAAQTIQAGFYTVEITAPGLSYRIQMGCQNYGPHTGNYVHMNITLSTSCKTIRFY